MKLLEYLLIRVYAMSWLGFFACILFFTLFYLVFKKYISVKSRKIWNVINAFLVLIFTLLVVYKVLLNRESTDEDRNVVLIPFLSYYRYFKGESTEALIMNRANILLFIPYGLFFYDFLKSKKRVILFVMIAFTFSSLLEFMQYHLALGTVEADDVIHNMLGAYLGYLLCYCYEKSNIYKKILIKLKLN